MSASIKTPLCALLQTRHPIMAAGMNGVSHAELVAASGLAGGIGCLGGLLMPPEQLRMEMADVARIVAEAAQEGEHKKECSQDAVGADGVVEVPFGVDLAIVQVGGSARKTNYDYTKGNLNELLDVICDFNAKSRKEEKGKPKYRAVCRLFVCAIGACPAETVDKFHKAGIVVMNMTGSARNAEKALANGVDIVCAQGTEGGGHTGSVGAMVLVPELCDLVAAFDKDRGVKVDSTTAMNMKTDVDSLVQRKNPRIVVGAGGIVDGRGV